jgi:hypothetical protein
MLKGIVIVMAGNLKDGRQDVLGGAEPAIET